MSGFPKTKFTIETADRKRFPVQQVIPQSKADLDGNYFATPVVMIRADARDLVPLALAARPTRLGARVVGIGFGADGNLKAAVGVVAAIDVTLRETKDRYVTVKFEGREDIAGTGGGPFINDEGDVVCMIFAGTDTDHECVPADLIRRALTRVLGSDPAR